MMVAVRQYGRWLRDNYADLRIRHFVARYRELAAAHKPIVAQQLAQESGYHSYSTFSTAFKQRMHKSVAAWMHEEALTSDKIE